MSSARLSAHALVLVKIGNYYNEIQIAQVRLRLAGWRPAQERQTGGSSSRSARPRALLLRDSSMEKETLNRAEAFEVHGHAVTGE